MKLGPKLTPPALDEDLVSRLARLADRLDGAGPGQCDHELNEFNRLAGTKLAFEAFQGIYKAENPEDFVRGVLYRKSLVRVPAVSVKELTEIVSRIIELGEGHDFYLELFLRVCKHPMGTDLIYWPDSVPELPQDREPTAREIAECALRWEPRTVAMRIMQVSGGKSCGYWIYNLEAPATPPTQVVTPLDVVYPRGTTVAVALRGVKLDDGTIVDTNFDLGAWSCGKILGLTEQECGFRFGN